jgi:hypothetical protein
VCEEAFYLILLRNFYVGISSWNRYVLDILAGGNFLGTPTLVACTLIESLVGVPPRNVVKTEVTSDEVLKKLSSLAFVGKEQKFMYVPKVSVPKPQHVFKIGKTFSSTKSDLQVESSSGTSKVPSVVSGDLEETVDLNASFENT